jgi:hypothetical protein
MLSKHAYAALFGVSIVAAGALLPAQAQGRREPD